MDGLRPCFVELGGKSERCLFHGFANVAQVVPPSPLRGGHQGGTVQDVLAVVETADGKIYKVYTESVTFADSEKNFKEVWGENE